MKGPSPRSPLVLGVETDTLLQDDLKEIHDNTIYIPTYNISALLNIGIC